LEKEKRRFGLIGYPLTHSFSPGYFADKFEKEGIFNTEYKSYSIDDVSKVFELLESGMEGLNVTIPYKEKVIPFLDELDASAKVIGAVNTIKNINGKTIGYNTDVIGFSQSLEKYLPQIEFRSALIFGTGGASKAVEYVLKDLGFDVKFVSRTKGDLSYKDVDQEIVDTHHLFVNTTPLGMYPKIDECPAIPFDYMTTKHFAYDLIYNPEKTLFLAKAESQGALIKNGLEMLELQAEASWAIWNSK